MTNDLNPAGEAAIESLWSDDWTKAPRDGSEVLLRLHNGGVHVGRWSTSYSVFGLGGCWTDGFSTMGDKIDYSHWASGDKLYDLLHLQGKALRLTSLPQPEGETADLVERLRAYAGPVRMDNGCSGELAYEAADTITSLSQRLAVAEGDTAYRLAAEAALAHARAAAIEDCAKVLDEMALRAAVDLDTDKQSRDPSILFRVRDMATHLYTGAAAALRAIQGSGKP